MRARRSATGSRADPAEAVQGPAPPRPLRPGIVERWSAALDDAAGGAVEHGRLGSPRRWPGPYLDLTPSDTVDPAAVRMLLAGRSVRLSQLIVPAAFPDVARRVRAVDRAARTARERHGLELVRIVLGTLTWDVGAPGPGTGDVPADDAMAPVLPALVALVDLSPRVGDDVDLVVRGPWEIAPAVLHRLSLTGIIVDPAVVIGPEGGGRPALDRLAAAGAEVPGFRVNQRVLVGVLPLLGRTAADDLEQLPELLANPAGEHPGGPFGLVAALAGDSEAIAALRPSGDRVAAPQVDDVADGPLAVLGADAGQRAVVEAAAQGGHVLVAAPPGTGTARTIVNLVATLAARGLSVLVVADEAATLRRSADLLAEAGLGDLVVDVAAAGPPETASARRRLADRLVAGVAGWADAGEAAPDPDRARFAELERTLLGHDRALHQRREPWGVTVHEVIGELLELERRSARAGETLDVVDLPRRVIAAISHRELEAVGDELAEWVRHGGAALAAGEGVWAGSVGLITDEQQATEVGALIRRMVDETLPAFRRELGPICDALGVPVAGSIRAAEELLVVLADLEALLGRYRAEVFDPTVPLDALEPTPDAPTGWRGWRRGRRSRRAAQTLLAAYRLDGAEPPASEVLDDLRSIQRLRAAWSEVGPGGRPPAVVPPTGGARRAVSTLAEGLGELAGFVPAVGTMRAGATLDELAEQLGALAGARASLVALPRIDQLRHRLVARELSPVLDAVARWGLGPDAAATLLRRSWLRSVLTELQLVDDAIGSADGVGLDSAADEIARLERRRRARHPIRVRTEVAARAAAAAVDHRAALDELSGLVADRVGSPRPIREVFAIAPTPLLAAAPCWFMSPHLVAEVLPRRVGHADERAAFDVVVIAGAERMSVAEAIPALVRARQTVVFGDPRRVGSGSEPSLFAAMAAVVPASRQLELRWFHRHGDGRLAALAELMAGREPSAVLAVPSPVSNAPIRLAPPDPDPLTAVVDLMIDHAVRHPAWSLAVVTATDEQAERLSAALHRARADDRVLDRLLAASSGEPVIVRSAGGLGGERRDHLIVVLGAAPSGDRPDVDHVAGLLDDAVVGAVAAAREMLTVIPPTDLDIGASAHRIVGPLALVLSAAAAGFVPTESGPVARPDPVMVDIADRLRARGVPVELVAGRVPELTLQHPSEPGRPVLAVLGDRPAHEALVPVIDRECLLPEHLTRLGWRWHRVRSLDWVRSPETELDRLLEAWVRLH